MVMKKGIMINDTWPILVEYNQRKLFAKLGYTENIEKLDVFKAECFAVISSEIESEREKAMKR